METDEQPERLRADELTRADRRRRRQEAERQRMPQHGRGMGVMIGNAILRRAAKAARRKGPSPTPYPTLVAARSVRVSPSSDGAP
jgi:hypothetical protein